MNLDIRGDIWFDHSVEPKNSEFTGVLDRIVTLHRASGMAYRISACAQQFVIRHPDLRTPPPLLGQVWNVTCHLRDFVETYRELVRQGRNLATFDVFIAETLLGERLLSIPPEPKLNSTLALALLPGSSRRLVGSPPTPPRQSLLIPAAKVVFDAWNALGSSRAELLLVYTGSRDALKADLSPSQLAQIHVCRQASRDRLLVLAHRRWALGPPTTLAQISEWESGYGKLKLRVPDAMLGQLAAFNAVRSALQPKNPSQ